MVKNKGLLEFFVSIAFLTPVAVSATPVPEKFCYDWYDASHELFQEDAIGVTDHYGNCVLTPLRLFNSHMAIAVYLAADSQDFDSAIINFRRAYRSTNDKYEKRDALRGEIASKIAKEILLEHGSTAAYLFFYQITGHQSAYD